MESFLTMFRVRFSPRFSVKLAAIFIGAAFATALNVQGATNLQPLTLDDLYSTGSERNESVLQAKEKYEQASETVSQARGGFFPQINLVGTYQRTDPGTVNSSVSSLFPDQQTNLKLTGKQYLFQGGAEYFTYSSFNHLESAAEQNFIYAKQNYYLSLAQTYFDALKSESQLRYAESEIKLYSDQVAELKKRVSIGRSRPSELMASQSALASSEARKKALESELFSEKTNLRTLSKMEGEIALKEALPFSKDLLSLEEYLKAAEERPDLKSALLTREAANRDLWAKRAGHMPTLDVSGNYWLKREGSNANSKWDATLTLTLPIFSGGITQSKVRAAASVYRQAEVTATQLQFQLRDEITNLYATLKNSIEEVKSLENAVDLAQKSFDQVSHDYRYGLNTYLDTLQSLKNLQDYRKQLDDARYRHYSERVRLEVRCGRLPKI